jgi:hypothetical protein
MFAKPGPGPEHHRGVACHEQAMLYKYPEPYGYRSRCEDGHVVVLAATQLPGLIRSLKGPTD